MSVDLSTPLIGSHVLLIEDDPNVARVLVLLLQDAGAEVVEASSAFQALKRIRHDSIEAVVCDLRLPDMYGGELLQYIRLRQIAAGRWIPAIALTGMTGADDRYQAMAAGFDRYLTKPLGIDKLISTLLDLLQEAGFAERIQS